MVEILTGAAAESAPNDGFAGYASPRAFRVGEALQSRAVDLLSAAFQGRWGADVRLAEAMSTSDFKLAAFAQLDTEMLAQYAELPSVWAQYTDQTTVNDFRPKRLLSRFATTRGFKPVPELSEYPEMKPGDVGFNSIQVSKHGGIFALSWEMWKNNEAIGELEDLPAALARAGRETETIAALSNLLSVGADGTASDLNTSFFKTANGNAPDTKKLTLDNLDTVLTSLSSKKNKAGRVIAGPPVVVVVPQSLATTAARIKATRLIRKTEGTTETEYDNYLASADFVVEPMLDDIFTHSAAATTWFVVPKPGATRPALWLAKLRGYETPEIRVKADTGRSVGGGDISPLEGSFEVDDIRYRGRHIVGNQVGDPTFTYVSRGTAA